MPIRKRQSGKAIDTQQNDQKGLDTVYNQGKDSGIHFINPIKHHHGNDGEVPRPRPLGVGTITANVPTTNMTNAAIMSRWAVKAKQ